MWRQGMSYIFSISMHPLHLKRAALAHPCRRSDSMHRLAHSLTHETHLLDFNALLQSTGMEKIKTFLESHDFRVFIAPEVATILFTNGGRVEDLHKAPLAFQQFILK
jgi:molybdopterin-guanine dinucleotide biosynthesis protein A